MRNIGVVVDPLLQQPRLAEVLFTKFDLCVPEIGSYLIGLPKGAVLLMDFEERWRTASIAGDHTAVLAVSRRVDWTASRGWTHRWEQVPDGWAVGTDQVLFEPPEDPWYNAADGDVDASSMVSDRAPGCDAWRYPTPGRRCWLAVNSPPSRIFRRWI